MIRVPRPLRPGDRIGVTSPSSGISGPLQARLDIAVRVLTDRGFEVTMGDCMAGDTHVSAPREQRAAELMAMLLDPEIAAVVPPWGGETAIDLLDLLDFEALGAADPCWLVGYSDLTTVMLPLMLRSGWATLHGANLMDTPYRAPEGMLHWLEVAAATGSVEQRAPGRYRKGFVDYVEKPAIDRLHLDQPGGWRVLGGGDAEVSGLLVGGCVEVLSPLAATPYADVPRFCRDHRVEGTLVFLEACEWTPYDVARALHAFRLAGWFDHPTGVLIGRPAAPDTSRWRQRDAVQDALGGLDVPVILDVDCGHVAPQLPLVTGVPTRVTVRDGSGTVHQELPNR